MSENPTPVPAPSAPPVSEANGASAAKTSEPPQKAAAPESPAPSAAPASAKDSEPEAAAERHRTAKVQSKDAVTENTTLGGYLHGLSEAFDYAIARPSVLGLIVFEAACWAVGAAIVLTLLFHAERVLQLQYQNTARYLVRALECVTIGFVLGAFGTRKACRSITPIFCYTPALLLAAYGLDGAMHPVAETGWTHLARFTLGLGAGIFAGRLGADLKAGVDAEFHERLLALKTIVCGEAVLLMVSIEMLLENAQFENFIALLPALLCLALPLVFVLSWFVDIAIHTRDDVAEIREFPGPLHRFGYRALRAIARTIFHRIFQYKPVDARNVPESGGVVIAANHGSFLDPILLSCATERIIQYVVYSTYYRSFAHPLFRFLRCIPVDEKDQLGALRTGVRSLKLGACIGIFPEGEVSADGRLHSPMRGALFLAQRSGAAVVGAALKGDYQALPRGTWIPHWVKVTPTFGKPFAVDKDLDKKDTEALTDKLMADLAQKLDVAAPPKIADVPEKKPVAEAK